MTGTENFCFRIGSGVGLWCDGPAAAGFRKGENIMELGEGLKKILLVGIDLGLKDFAVVSNGTVYRNINKTASESSDRNFIREIQRNPGNRTEGS